MALIDLEELVVKFHNPKWGKISIMIFIFSSGLSIMLPPLIAKVGTAIFGVTALITPRAVRRSRKGIQITCIQSRPKNSVENHHNGRFRISHGIGHLETYIDIPDWATEFDILIKSDPTIKIVPWDNKPDSVRLEGNHLRSNQDLNGFPITLKIVGDPDEIAEGEYTLEFIDMRSKRKIKEIELKGDPDPPENIDVTDLEQEEAEEWGLIH